MLTTTLRCLAPRRQSIINFSLDRFRPQFQVGLTCRALKSIVEEHIPGNYTLRRYRGNSQYLVLDGAKKVAGVITLPLASPWPELFVPSDETNSSMSVASYLSGLSACKNHNSFVWAWQLKGATIGAVDHRGDPLGVFPFAHVHPSDVEGNLSEKDPLQRVDVTDFASNSMVVGNGNASCLDEAFDVVRVHLQETIQPAARWIFIELGGQNRADISSIRLMTKLRDDSCEEQLATPNPIDFFDKRWVSLKLPGNVRQHLEWESAVPHRAHFRTASLVDAVSSGTLLMDTQYTSSNVTS